MFFSRDPGSANCLVPVYQKLQNISRIQADIWNKDFVYPQYKKAGIVVYDIGVAVPLINESSIYDFLIKENYYMVVTGTTCYDPKDTDKLLWKAARKRGIYSIAILDQWSNYQCRFTMMRKKLSEEKMVFPDIICVMDEYARNELVLVGVPLDRIVVTGQPYFETALNNQQKITESQKAILHKKLHIQHNDKIIVFAAEAREDLDEDASYWGYTDDTIFAELLKGMHAIASRHKDMSFVILIKIHPRSVDGVDSLFNVLIKKEKLPDNVRVAVIRDILPQLLIGISYLVLGTTSMLLIEAAIARKPYASIQIGLRREDEFILTKMKLSKTILSKEKLLSFLKDILIKEKKPVKNFPFVHHATQNIIGIIKRML